MSELIITHKHTQVGRQTLRRGTVNIGRAPSNDVVLDSPVVDAHHARIITAGRLCHIQDLGSENGTFVNESRIHRTELRDNDQIRIGHYRMVIHARDAGDADAGGSRPAEGESDTHHAAARGEQQTTGQTAAEADPGVDGFEILNGPNRNKQIRFSRFPTALGVGSLKAVVIREVNTENTHRREITAVNPTIAVRINGVYMATDQPQVVKSGDQVAFLNMEVRFLAAPKASEDQTGVRA